MTTLMTTAIVLSIVIIMIIFMIKLFSLKSTYWKYGANRYEVRPNGQTFRITKKGRRVHVKHYPKFEEVDLENILYWVEDSIMFNEFFNEYNTVDAIRDDKLDIDDWDSQEEEALIEQRSADVENHVEGTVDDLFSEEVSTAAHSTPEPSESHFSSSSSSSSYESSSSSSSDYSSSSDSGSDSGGSDD